MPADSCVLKARGPGRLSVRLSGCSVRATKSAWASSPAVLGSGSHCQSWRLTRANRRPFARRWRHVRASRRDRDRARTSSCRQSRALGRIAWRASFTERDVSRKAQRKLLERAMKLPKRPESQVIEAKSWRLQQLSSGACCVRAQYHFSRHYAAAGGIVSGTALFKRVVEK